MNNKMQKRLHILPLNEQKEQRYNRISHLKKKKKGQLYRNSDAHRNSRREGCYDKVIRHQEKSANSRDAVKSGLTQMLTTAGGGDRERRGGSAELAARDEAESVEARHQVRGGERQSCRPPVENEDDDRLK